LPKCPISDGSGKGRKFSVKGRKNNRKDFVKCGSRKAVGKSSQDRSFFTSSA
jgi:hypothetical protein